MEDMKWMDEKSLKEDALEERSRGKQYKRKKTAKWCKGKVGKEHKYEIVIDHVYANLSLFKDGCGYGKWNNGPWICIHTWECSVCGKKKYLDPEDCPDRKS